MGDPDPGYVAGYVPGVRENGGQHTHGAAWLAWAFADVGDGDRAHALFDLLNPIRRAQDARSAWTYRLEPYVVAADVYAVPPRVGRGGWSWYTGSAARMQRLGVEAILGLHRTVYTLRVRPVLPSSWTGYEATVRRGKSRYDIVVKGPAGMAPGRYTVSLDGRTLAGPDIPFVDDGARHRIVVEHGVPLAPDVPRPSQP